MLIGGLDIGTTGCKLSTYDSLGNPLDTYYEEYNITRNSGKHEIDAGIIWNSVKSVIKQADGLDAIGVTSFGETFVMLDDQDHILLPSMLYTDPRGQEECNCLDAEKITRITGVKPHYMYSLPKMMWVKKKEPALYAKASRILLIQDFIVYMLTGTAQIDYSLAARTMAFDIRQKCWSNTILDFAEISCEKLSVPVPSGTVAGVVRKELAQELHLSDHTKIVSGAHDQVAAAVGLGIFEPGSAVDGTGTVECITPLFTQIPSEQALYESGYAVVPYVLPDTYVCYALSFTGGAVLKWYRDNFGQPDWDMAQKNGQNVYALLDSKMPEDPTGLLVLPHFAGAANPYMDPDSRAAILGLTLEHTRYDIYKALMEGVTFEILHNIKTLENMGINFTSIRATGGGASSPKWLQLKADILGRPVTALDTKEAGAAGTAMLAAVSLGVFDRLQDAAKVFVREKDRYVPRTCMNQQYSAIYKTYQKVYHAVRPLIGDDKNE